MPSSLPNKLFDNQRGFPTPDAAPDETGCRVFVLPADEEWFALLMGAISALTSPYNWYRNGSLTQQEAADAFSDIMDAAYALSEAAASCPSGVPTPFWDTATDSDDEYPPGELTPWYGIAVVTYASPPDVTFIEQLGIWAIAGFIAYAGAPFGAIAFLTIAPKFVIAFKTGDIGGIVDIIVDSSRVGRYNTYSPSAGVLRIPIVGNPDLDTHQIYLVKDDDPDTRIDLIRDELNPNDVAPTNRRYNAIDDTVEVHNPDDTWTANDGADPRSSTGFEYGAVVADDPACQAASNMSRWINNLIDSVLLVIAEANDAAGLLTVLVGLVLELGPFGILIDLALALAFVLFSAGATALSAAFTSTVYDQLTCIFFCHVDSDGKMSAEQLAAAQAQIDSEIGGLVAAVLDGMLFLLGNVGLTNAGTIDDGEPVDCSGCDCNWCWEWDETAIYTEESWTIHQSVTDHAITQAEAAFNALITHAEFDYSLSGFGAFGDGQAQIYDQDFPGSTLESGAATNPTGTLIFDDPLGVSVTAFGFAISSLFASGSNYPVITRIHLEGIGTVPAFGNGIAC